MARPRERLARSMVTRTEREGKNLRLHLSCGHSRLHGIGKVVPDRAFCGECPAPLPSGPDRQ